jgi:hypothetical protein
LATKIVLQNCLLTGHAWCAQLNRASANMPQQIMSAK